MFRHHHQLLPAVACASLVALCCQSAWATILTFDMTTHPGPVLGGFESTYATYGDNVSATSAAGPGVTYGYGMGTAFTPNITVAYSHLDNTPTGSLGNSPYPAAGGWSDPVDYLHYQDGDLFWMEFTPTGLIGVQINSFAIDLFGGGGTLNWNLRQTSTGGPIIASGTEASLVTSDPDRIVNIVGGSFFGPVVLEFSFSGTGNAGIIGIDDVNFNQISVPEPSTLALLGLGAVGLAVRTRRRRTVT